MDTETDSFPAFQNNVQEFHYKIPWRTHSSTPGHHHSSQSGGGYEFHGHASLISHPDPRNLDIHASLHDPLGQYAVRTFRQRSAVPVYVIVDLSASMGFQGTADKLHLLAQMAAIAAYSAFRTGDPFGLFACADAILWPLCLPLRYHRGIPSELYRRLSAHRPTGGSISSLLGVAGYLARKRALVFLISDFHFPKHEISQLLDSFAFHDVVPMILWDSTEYRKLPRWGITCIIDPETGQERSLFLRPCLHDRLIVAFEDRRHYLTHLCRQYGREPFFVEDKFDPDQLTHYFYC